MNVYDSEAWFLTSHYSTHVLIYIFIELGYKVYWID